MQLDTRERGFSYSYDRPLDMRMDPDSEPSAGTLLAEIDERRLAGILRDYGEERYARAIARAIVRRRSIAPLRSTQELVEDDLSGILAFARFAGGHPAKRSFQALRIAVNYESDSSTARSRRRGSCCVSAACGRHLLPLARGPARQAFPRPAARGAPRPARPTRMRRGREAEAALLSRRSIVPGAEERAAECPSLLGPPARGAPANRATITSPPPATVPSRRTTALPKGRGLSSVRPPRRVSGPAPGRRSAPPAPRSRLPRPLAALARGVGRVSRHPLIDRVITGRWSIAVIAFALIGIVTLQLGLLKLNVGVGRSLEQEQTLERENATLGIENAELASPNGSASSPPASA